MKKNSDCRVLARPNLKGFILLALAIIAVQQLINTSVGTPSLPELSTLPPRQHELEKLIDQSLSSPTQENFLILSDSYRRLGDPRKALHYLRKASMLTAIESGQ